MAESCLPNFAEEFASEALLARLPSGHYAARRGQDVDTQASEHARNFGAANVYPAPGTRDPRHIRDRRLIITCVFQVDADDLVAFLFGSLEVRDIALLFEDAGNLHFQVGSGNIHLLVPRTNRVANSRQHVCDRIGQIHRLLLLSRPFSPLSGEPATARVTPTL